VARVVRCQGCPGLCCKAFDAVVLAPGDASRLARFLKLTPSRFARKYLTYESMFNYLCRMIDGRGQDGQRVTIELNMHACPFLDTKTGRCTVYAARPKACRVFKPGNNYCRRLRREHGQHRPQQPL